ncbi:MAG: PIN domain-containing protein [Calditrichaeota bacterium]|nr:MAG: PIN domain-containing protein [Calditrichota bacterium]
MSQISDIRNYMPRRSDSFFFDSNIWMYLYCPLGNYSKRIIKPYGQFLQRVIRAKSKVYISSLVLSEFYNAYLRLEFNIRKAKSPAKYADYKMHFKGTKAYFSLLADINATVKNQILKLAYRIDDEFSHIDVLQFLTTIKKCDFNDAYYSMLAAIREMIIVTNDQDFYAEGRKVKILTANRKLLKKNN